MRKLVLLLLFASLTLAACATSEPPRTALEFTGTLDLSRPGVGFHLSHASGLACQGHVTSSRLPDKFVVPLKCGDQLVGSMEAVKTERIEGTVTLGDGRSGKVAFDLPLARRGTTGKRGAGN